MKWKVVLVTLSLWENEIKSLPFQRVILINFTAAETLKKIIIIAGPNGAGKTTFARDFLPQEAHMLRFVNADLIASGLSPFNPEVAAIKAARLMLREIDECASKGESFSFETTLSGLNYLRRIKDWKADGYIVKNLVHLASLS